MNVAQLIRALQQFPPKAEVYTTDDGTTHLPEWNAHIEDVHLVDSASNPVVIMEFEGAWLRTAIDSDQEAEEEGEDE